MSLDVQSVVSFVLSHLLEFVLSSGVALLGICYKRMLKELKQQKVEREAVRSLLRNEIISQHQHYLSEGSIPVYGRENLTSMYSSYHALGGNGTVTALMEEVMALPTRQK